MENKKLYTRRTFWRSCRQLLELIVPQRSSLYKWFYLNAVKVNSKKRNRKKQKLSFKYHTVDGCNLNCIGCSTFSPLVDNSFVDISFFEKDIKRMSELGDIEMMELIGGEVLLHPNIMELLEVSRKYIAMGKIALVTNGVLLVKQGVDFWESCKRNNISIKTTPYPIKLDIEKIIEMAERYEVDLSYYYGGSKIFFVKYPLNIDGKDNVIKNFSRCDSSVCDTLRDGKMYSCYKSYCIKFFNEYYKMDFKVSEMDFKDIYNTKDLDELLDFMCSPTPFCRYCDLNNSKFGIPWGISKKDIKEWI